MKKYRQLQAEVNTAFDNTEKSLKQMDSIILETHRVKEVTRNADIYLADIEEKFNKYTKLNSLDMKFLFTAVALQCVRQYVIGTLTQRTDDQTAANNTKGHNKEHSNRSHKWYEPSINEILTNPVPFDATYGSKHFNLGVGGGFTHRAKTLGHDPLLGWIFGTMNIATSTVTLSEGFRSFHVTTGYTSSGSARDKISYHANTGLVIKYSGNKLLHEGIEGKEKIGLSLIKEAIHLKSDIYSTASLPLPIISAISVPFARELADYGLDMGNVIKVSSQAGYAVLINALISMVHRLFYDESIDYNVSLYEVRTRKILSYSNLIASASNVIAVAIGAAAGTITGNAAITKKSLNYLDLGGILVTIHRIVNDRKFQYEIKKEFIENQWYNLIMEG